jgi:branched-chain amino acid transport system permease protein
MTRAAPYLLLPVMMLLAWPLMSGPSWIALTVAGLAMGMMLFLMASGLTLVFGLMDVLNFAHGGFITLGAYVAVSVLAPLTGWVNDGSWTLNLLALAAAVLAAAIASGVAGFAFEAIIIRRVYGAHLQQVLITVGGLIVADQLIVAVWGPQPLSLQKPAILRGSFLFGGAAIETFRMAAVVLGLAVYAGMHLILNRTRLGLVVRAAVENREMVEALGYRITRLFVGVFVAGSALAGLGGAMWAQYQETVTPSIGAEMSILVFIVVIIGGLGSVGGCFTGAMLVGLTANYVGFLVPKLALGSNIALMVLILLWRPRGLFPVGGQ